MAGPTAQLGFSQLHNELGMSSPGPSRVDASVERRSGFQARVAQQLPDQLVGARGLRPELFLLPGAGTDAG